MSRHVTTITFRGFVFQAGTSFQGQVLFPHLSRQRSFHWRRYPEWSNRHEPASPCQTGSSPPRWLSSLNLSHQTPAGVNAQSFNPYFIKADVCGSLIHGFLKLCRWSYLVEGGRVGSVCFAVLFWRALCQLWHLSQDLSSKHNRKLRDQKYYQNDFFI